MLSVCTVKDQGAFLEIFSDFYLNKALASRGSHNK